MQRLVITEIPGRGVMTLPILAARPVLEFIADVHRSGRAEIRWHSTWRTAAVTSFAPALGLPTTIPMSVAPGVERPAGRAVVEARCRRTCSRGRTHAWCGPTTTCACTATRPSGLAGRGQPAHRTVQRHRPHPRRTATDRGIPGQHRPASQRPTRTEPRSTYEQAFDGRSTKFSRLRRTRSHRRLRGLRLPAVLRHDEPQRVGPLVEPQRVRPVRTRRQGVVAAEAVDLHRGAGRAGPPSRHMPGR